MKRDKLNSLFIHATNVHQGGGRSLLLALFEALPEKKRLIGTLDTRMVLPQGLSEKIEIRRVRPSALQRFKAEWWIARNAKPEDVVLCLGNLPPLFRVSGHTIVFVQNRYLVENISLQHLPFKTKMRIRAERLWLFWKAKHADEFVVQTPSMSVLLKKRIGDNIPVRIMPFANIRNGYKRSLSTCDAHKNVRDDFVYIASGEFHKNHRQLVEAWCLLAKEGIFPSLRLTVADENAAELCRWIEEKKELHGLKIENLGMIPYEEIKHVYSQAGALIYPSTLESLGLPLIEARQAGLSVLASELDFVRDVLDPEQSFDPESSVSIARAVKRFLGVKEQQLHLLEAGDFIKRIMEKVQ